MSEKMRVHILAKEMNVTSKTIIEKCKAEGITAVKNHMSTLSAGLHATICEWFSDSGGGTAIETSERVNLQKARIPKPRKRKKKEEPIEEAPAQAVIEAATEVSEPAPAEPQVPAPARTPEMEPAVETVPTEVAAEMTSVAVAEAPTPAEAIETVVAAEPEAEPSEEPAPAKEAGVAVAEAPAEAPAAEAPVEEGPPAKPITPAGPQNVPVPAKLQGPRVVRYEAPDRDVQPIRRTPRPRPPEGGAGPPRPPPTLVPGAPPVGDKTAPDRVVRRKGRFSPRRAAGRATDAGEKLAEWRDRDLAERKQRLAGATGRRIHQRRAVQDAGGPGVRFAAGPKTEATVHEPVHIKELCSATGLNFLQLFKVLKEEHNIVANVNMTLQSEVAQLLALHFGIDLLVIPSKTMLDEIQEEFASRERQNEQPRPPVVTFLGHVDHGKTTLMDAIRKTRVVHGEDGGITQHIGSYHLETPHGAVTLLDTPGHEAFTAMRARGAQVTDVVVLVVAADDGVMPQTVEAINHAQAAGVPIVVALNKIDLGDENRVRIYGQLSERGLTPAGDWGGEVDVVPTSATTGEGVAELVEHLAALSAILELKADPTLPACGTVVEAETKSGVGAVAQVLIQEGTLRVGDCVVCGNGFGKVRALLDDRGRRIQEAGPAIPVEVWGLDDVPASGDKLYNLDNLQRAKSIAAEIKQTRLASSRVQSTKVHTLEEMLRQRESGEVPELNVIIKADVDGSVAALRYTLGQFPTDEVKLVVRHSAVGPVNDSDVLLAEACKAIIIAFRVDTPSGARRLGEQHGVDIRSYRVIYDVHDEIKKALEGLLEPEERIEARAVAEVRQVFHITKVGTVAGSFVTEGTVNRSHFAKVLRDGLVVRDRCTFASLRRFKDDAKEVRSQMECGIRLEGFDDLHVGDVIETFEIVKIARTLQGHD